jgi:hypothetical protein
MEREHPRAWPEDAKVVAMLLCDHAHRDLATGKFSLLGIFDRVHARSFPTTHGPFSIYLNVTNLNGAYDVAVQVVRAADESPIGETKSSQPIVVRDPLARVEMAMNLPGGLPLEKPGAYLFRLILNGKPSQDLVMTVLGPAEAPSGA